MGDEPSLAASGLRALLADLEELDLRLERDGETARRTAVHLIRDVIVPRLDDDAMPLVVAVIGPSGSGKSTLINALAGAEVVPAGPLRPTTRGPIAWSAHPPPPPLDALRRRYGLGEAATAGRPPPEGLVVIDAPPSGPVAAALVDAADVALLVASDRRYADAATWDLVDRAAARRLPMVFVLGRLPVAPEEQRPLLADFAARLADRGLVDRADPEAIIGIPEGAPGAPIPVEWAAGVRKELDVFTEPAVRRLVRQRVVHAALGELRRLLSTVRGAVVDAEVLRRRLLDPVARLHHGAAAALVEELHDGGLADVAALGETIAGDVAAVVTRRLGHAARASAEIWAADREGARLLEGDRGLWSHDPGGPDRVRSAVEEWRHDLQAVIDGASPWWVRRRTRSLMAEQVIARVLEADPPAGDRRAAAAGRRVDGLDGVVEHSRRALGGILQAALVAGEQRFVDAAGRGPEPVLLSRLVVDREAAAHE